jgi:TPR repeat protein
VIKSEVDKAGGLANPKCRQALHGLVKAAEQGNLDSMHVLGLIFDSGELVQQDIEEAIRWYRAAVEKGHAGAAYNLGLCYENHLVDPHMHDVRLAATTSKDKYSRTAALDLYKLAAERGNMMAQSAPVRQPTALCCRCAAARPFFDRSRPSPRALFEVGRLHVTVCAACCLRQVARCMLQGSCCMRHAVAVCGVWHVACCEWYNVCRFKVGQFSEEGVGCVADGFEASRWCGTCLARRPAHRTPLQPPSVLVTGTGTSWLQSKEARMRSTGAAAHACCLRQHA